MKKLLLCLMGLFALTVFAAGGDVEVVDLGDGHGMVRINPTQKYLILPVEDTAPGVSVSVIVDNVLVESFSVCLAVNKVDYTVPYDLSKYAGKHVVLRFATSPLERGGTRPKVKDAVFSSKLTLANSYDASNKEPLWRPVYHFAPQWGWMNDPNGMVYKDGEYHLFYQYNPYGSRWGNMNWGHAISRDLVTWEHLPVAIAPDGLGTIFSGSAVVDKNNTAGFGAGAIVAFYTQASARQMQSIAYSTDNGRTFKKYAGNPVLTGDVADFRDPKVSWHEGTKKWILTLAVGQEIRFYSSPNLKDWTYESNFGEGQGCHDGVWECPDLFELPVAGTNQKKWVLVVNINPGGPFGGSATQYFVGSFDGHKFVNESPKATKWMDFGKDHYATVTWSNAPQNRVIALAWMSNWQYANNVPTMQFRSANSVPRDLQLFQLDGETYLQSAPSPELLKLRGEKVMTKSFSVGKEYSIDKLISDNAGTYEIVMTVRQKKQGSLTMRLMNEQSEEISYTLDMAKKELTCVRDKSGVVGFSQDFVTPTVTQIEGGDLQLRFFVDRCSVEAFVNDGRFVLTNLVFPHTPYNKVVFDATGGSVQVKNFTVYNFKN
ncbi:MAG: GH32 C-terminal domain-containing protein [Bacteroidaceae bacterium]|nr:GH32 C-terminal domain-containing protein [Bacteroidaceae bacterium]